MSGLFYIADRGAPSHVHKWSPWSARYVLGAYEKRYCECGAFQARRSQAMADAIARALAT